MIDRDHLSAQTFGDADLAREVLGLFVQQCSRLMPLIRDGSIEPGLRADHVHTLRGSAVGIGANAVSQVCAILEDALRRNEPDEKALDRLSDAVDATVLAIAS
ncbi:MAG: Hpt domain-containing protein [Methylobacterium sp.]|uniref:Hpt domain-containing protein n=1 Tax=Methylobacterium sp. TaxID=409 RepID=UPI0025DC5B9E|nr:Hpt domain-containing protein [Methylobacterium sp.]MBX9930237.1 Hpt domain-containing protein [Methylobacterium sp.]